LLGRAVAASTGPIATMPPGKRERLRNPKAPRRLVEWLNGSRAPGVATVDITLPGPAGAIPARVYRPAASTPPSGLPVMVAFHGGGFVFGNLDTGDWLCSNVCVRAPAIVVSVGYRLAPEHPAPAAHLDAYAATAWVAEHAGQLGGRADQLAVFGDSSGGTLAASVALAARDKAGPDIVLQALAYPITDLTVSSPSIKRYPREPLLRAADLRAFIELYLGSTGDPRDPALSPLLAQDHSGLPPALILTADHDPLLDDGRRYARRLHDGGVAVEAVEFGDAPHGFFSFPRHCAAAPPALETLVHSLRSVGTGNCPSPTPPAQRVATLPAERSQKAVAEGVHPRDWRLGARLHPRLPAPICDPVHHGRVVGNDGDRHVVAGPVAADVAVRLVIADDHEDQVRVRVRLDKGHDSIERVLEGAPVQVAHVVGITEACAGTPHRHGIEDGPVPHSAPVDQPR